MDLRTSIATVLIALVAAACAGSTASSTPGATPTPSTQTYWLRMTTTQAIAPLDAFGLQPPLRITGDGIAVVDGPVPAIFPGPLMPNLVGRQVSGAGQARIITAARDLGLLDGRTDFTGGGIAPGGVVGHLEITLDGRRIELTGDPSAHIVCVTTPCEPAPGTREAFGTFWQRLTDLGGWLGSDLGPEAPYVAPAYAILVGSPPQQQPGFGQPVADWPLDVALAQFGSPVGNGAARCGTVSGPDAVTLRPSLMAANQLTMWTQDPQSSVAYGLTVRPMVPGEDTCREIFGGG